MQQLNVPVSKYRSIFTLLDISLSWRTSNIHLWTSGKWFLMDLIMLIRSYPPPISSPLYTKSNDFEGIFILSILFSSSIDWISGLVNGWWQHFIDFSGVLVNIGNLFIHNRDWSTCFSMYFTRIFPCCIINIYWADLKTCRQYHHSHMI